MEFSQRIAYHMLTAVMLIAPTTWGCSNGSGPIPPPEAKQAEEEGGTKEPVVEIGTPADSSDGTTGDSTGSTAGEDNSDGE